MIKCLRSITRLIFFLLLFIIPVLNILEIYFIKGTYISLDIGLLSISDPLAIAQAAFLSDTINTAMLASLVIPIAAALILGRVWCGWACPYYTITCIISRKNNEEKYDPRIKRRANIIRFTVLILGFAFVGIAGVPLLFLISPPSLLSSQSIMIIKHMMVTIEFALILIILITDIVSKKRLWCRYICPTGSSLSILRNKHTLSVKYSGRCSGCKECIKVCPALLDPRKDGADAQCTNCAECIIKCPEKSLYYDIV